MKLSRVNKILEELGLEKAKSMKAVSGGDINEAYQLKLDDKSIFLKSNSEAGLENMLFLEAKGLETLAKTGTFKVPKVIAQRSEGNSQYLFLEWLETESGSEQIWKDFGHNLALLHLNQSKSFGLDHNNHIGSLKQVNLSTDTWEEFYFERRLLPILEMLKLRTYDTKKLEGQLDTLRKNFSKLLPQEPASLLHGDLWSGNYILANKQAYLIDPSIYFGHREMDLAMMKLFGGFPDQLFQAYEETYPLAKAWEKRIPIHQIYPLLVHAQLFGSEYIIRLERQLDLLLNKF